MYDFFAPFYRFEEIGAAISMEMRRDRQRGATMMGIGIHLNVANP